MYLFPRWKETISGTRKKRYVVTWDPLPLPITLHNKIHYPPSALGECYVNEKSTKKISDISSPENEHFPTKKRKRLIEISDDSD